MTDIDEDYQHIEFQYLLRDKETVVNFDAPTEVLQKYLEECLDSITQIKIKIENTLAQGEVNPDSKDDDWHDGLRRLKTALNIQFGLRSRLTLELKNRKQGDIELLQKAIEKRDETIKKQKERIAEMRTAIERLKAIDPTKTESETTKKLKDAFATIEAKDKLIGNQRVEITRLNEAIKKLKEEPKDNRIIEDLRKKIAKRDSVIQELIGLDNASVREIQIALRELKNRQQENRTNSTYNEET